MLTSLLRNLASVKDKMKWIVVTSPSFVEGEVTFIERLFLHGLDLLHVRKPGATEDECRKFIESIPIKWRDRMVLHDHLGLALEYGLHGVHLNRRNPSAPKGWQGSVSCSCHSLDEVEARKPCVDYLFLSPIFDSISKQGYGAAFSANDLSEAARMGIIDDKVIALGGMTLDGMPMIKQWHFGGAAFLGDIWGKINAPTDEVDAYLEKLRTALSR